MKKVVFIGAYDKTDMLLYIAKLLTMLNKKVILIDTTLMKKSRYIVPTMKVEKKYITTYQDIDVAIGFENFEAIQNYQKKVLNNVEEYDIALYDIDRTIAYKSFELNKKDIHYFVTSFDMFNVKKGIQVLYGIDEGTTISKIYFTKNMDEEEDNYINYLTQKFKIKWNKNNIIFFPFETEDLNAIFINQRAERLNMQGLSTSYIDSIKYLVEEISGENSGKVKKAYKEIEFNGGK